MKSNGEILSLIVLLNTMILQRWNALTLELVRVQSNPLGLFQTQTHFINLVTVCSNAHRESCMESMKKNFR